MKDNSLAAPGRFTLEYILLSFVFGAMTLLLLWLSVTVLARMPGETTEADIGAVEDRGDAPICLVLDAGHGGEDGGAVGISGLLEKNVNLQLVMNLRDLFALADIPVVLTRSDDRLLYDPTSDYRGHKKMQDLRNRLELVKQTPGSVLLSIHLNSFSQSKYSGLQVYYAKRHPDSARLAEHIQTLTRAALQPDNDRKTKPAGSNIYLLDRTDRPAVLIECGFLSNPGECAKLADPVYLNELSTVIFAAVCDYLADGVGGT